MRERRYTEWFRFMSSALSGGTFHVVRFSGTEGLNTLFRFTIDLVSADASVDLEEVLNAPASFTILREGADDAVFYGYPTRVEQGGHFNGYTYYKVELRPALWKLTQVRQTAIFLNQNVQAVTEGLLSSESFFTIPHEFRLTGNAPSPEFAMQYGESVYDYILWRMEEQGAYFYFSPNEDKVIFADNPLSHDNAAVTLFYSPTTGLEGDRREEVLSTFSLSQTPLPRQVVVRSYDWKNPNRVIVGTAEVSARGLGDVYLPNENVESEADANRLAKIRAEELICRSRVFTSTGSVPILRPGVVFTLDRHYNPAFNRDYLVTEITHEGGQEAFLSLGLGIPLRGAAEHFFYHNSFSCIEAGVTYRPARMAPRSKVSGVIRAFVDGAGSGARPEMDEYGRYKLIFPFDISGRRAGNASCWVRMAQQQTGKDSGLSFPLLPGTEVAVTFIDGNPDRPIIAGALANGETGTISGAGNSNFSGIRTAGGNQVTINDTDTKQGLSLLTASGHGLTMTAGSLDSATSTTDAWLSTASVFASDFAGVCKSDATGYKVTQGAFRDKSWEDIVSGMAAGFCSASGKALDSLSSKFSDGKTSEGLEWGAEGAKLLGAALAMFGDIKLAKDTPANRYGYSLTAAQDRAVSLLQVKPEIHQMLKYVIPWLLARLGNIGSDVVNEAIKADGIESAGKKNFITNLKSCMDDLKSDADYAVKYAEGSAMRTAADSAPCSCYTEVDLDMSALIASRRSGMEAISRGGKMPSDQLTKLTNDLAEFEKHKSALETNWKRWCDNSEDNKDYYQWSRQRSIRKAITSATTDLLPELTAFITLFMWRSKLKDARLGGISLNSPDGNLNLNAQRVITEHSDQGIILNAGTTPAAPTVPFSRPATLADLVGSWDRTAGSLALAGNSPHSSAWGVDDIESTFMDEDLGFLGGQQELPHIPQNAPQGYLALCAPFHYEKTTDKIVFADNVTQFGNSCTIRTGSRASTLFMDRDWFKVSNGRDGNVLLAANAPDNAHPPIGLAIDASVVKLAHQNNASLRLNANQAQLQFEDNRNSLGINAGGLQAKGSEITVESEGNVNISGKKISIGGIVVEGGSIKGNDKGVLEISGAVKIMGTNIAVSLKDLDKSIQKNAKTMDDALKAFDEKLKELEKNTASTQTPTSAQTQTSTGNP